MTINVAGGTYFEECFEPYWHEIYGSGLRGALTILGIDNSVNTVLHTFGNNEVNNHLNYLTTVFPKLGTNVNHIDESLTFKYNHPLADPLIYPRLDTVNKDRNTLLLEEDNIVLFGTLDGKISVKGKKVVYDPQSPVNPIPFKKTNSTAERLVVITNLSEAKIYTGKEDILEIKESILQDEEVEAVIIKDGPKGAHVYTKNSYVLIPAFKTKNVWSIGSGDVFTTSFAYYWINKNLSIEECALQASYNAAQYCNSKRLTFENLNSSIDIKPIYYNSEPNEGIYLAGPFFNFAQRWLIQQVRDAILTMDVSVFSPWHDIGFGIAEEVVPLDIAAIDKSSLVLALIDGLDTGTIFEVGYARAKNIPVVVFVQNETSEALKMLEGTGCEIYGDLTTAVYNSVWNLLSHE